MGRGRAVWYDRGELDVVVDTWRSVVEIEEGSRGIFWDRYTGETETNQKLNVLRIGLRSLDLPILCTVSQKITREKLLAVPNYIR